MHNSKQFPGADESRAKGFVRAIFAISMVVCLGGIPMAQAQNERQANALLNMIQAYQGAEAAARAEIVPQGPAPMRQRVIINNYGNQGSQIVTPENYENPYDNIYKGE